jgi:murein DD-endopeptidase MepM/ murein hydrolase activator NlpD
MPIRGPRPSVGRDVIAAADGEVMDVRNGFADDPALLKRKGETEDAYSQRMGLVQLNFLKTDFTAAAGNFIVIRHKGEEYSFYAHLKKDSLRVIKGDLVKQGQVIAQVGHSGNSTEPHLHFQISNGADPFRSRAVPVQFTYLDGEKYLRTGDIIRN